MSLLLVALALAAPSRLLVLEDTYEIARADWAYKEVLLAPERPILHCEFQVVSGQSPVRLVVLPPADLERFRTTRSHPLMAATPFGSAGKLRHAPGAPGTYAVLIQKHESSHRPVQVRLRIEVESPRVPRELSPARRTLIIGLSLAVFFGILLYARRKLWPYLRGAGP